MGRARARVALARQQVDATRTRVPSVDVALGVYERDQRVAGNLLACAVAYRLFLWLLPLSLLVAAVLGFLRDAGTKLPSDVAASLGLGGYVTSTVVEASDQAQHSRWVLLVIAVLGLYSASSGGAKTFRAVSAIAWGIDAPKPRHGWLAGVAFAGFALAVGGAALAANWARDLSSAFGLSARLGMLGVFLVVGLATSLLLPHRDVPWQWLLPGAALIAVGTQLMHLFTVLYLADQLTSQSQLYGGLGAAATVLLWLYLIGRLVIASLVLNATMWDRHGHRSPTSAE